MHINDLKIDRSRAGTSDGNSRRGNVYKKTYCEEPVMEYTDINNHVFFPSVNNSAGICPDGMDISYQSRKRMRMDDVDQSMQHSTANGVSPTCFCAKRILPVRKGEGVYVTEDWKSTGTSLFKPLVQDIYVNTVKYEQFSVSEGNFFVADTTGNYSKSVKGKVLHMWRYDKTKRQLFIAQSILFACQQTQDFNVIEAMLCRM